ncbi:hypothetical protein R6242_21245 [Iodobacter sp. CM08]|uniref:hypothetical protein n=1 Tax=Iodobacter sp. CM08 TaxID=3085902 RepID=UPI002981B3F1|nr:hypothetical protein [Iodobacter sp. CM08]MDW5419102.1 hypothetical protein [Iodobacter sp. CM08]
MAAEEGVIAILGLSLTGWGLVLLGLGMLAYSGAGMITPTKLQDWAKDCYFGSNNVFVTAQDEEKALMKLLTPITPSKDQESIKVMPRPDNLLEDNSISYRKA